uniref:G protein nucleolar 3 like n=1 Tax=Saimiri boliviensis boliviensis TaxID=39432 RepID=A0A2K6V1P1_SAIBB
MMKLRHKNKKPDEGSEGHKKPAKQNGKKATSKVPSALHLVHSDDHANREAELKKMGITEMQQVAWEQERQKRRAIESYCEDVLRRQEEFEKAYYKEVRKVVEYSDVILEVLDARDPSGCRCFQIEEAVLRAQGNKKLVLVLNKIDLVPKEVVEKWLDYFQNELLTVAFKASTQHQVKNLNCCSVPVDQASESLLKTENPMRVLGNYCRLGEVHTHIGSSLIDSLKHSHACSMGAVSGITTFMEEVHLDKLIWLLDASGIVPGPNSEVGTILRNCVHVQKLADPVTPVETILQRCNLEEISNNYSVSGFQTTEHFCTVVAHHLGKKKGGLYSQEQAAKAVLADWVSGNISFYIPPPPTHSQSAHLSAEIVKEVTEANEDTMECLATGESDELLGGMDPLEMEIKLLHSSMMKIADAIESKTTMYKIGDLTGYCTNLNHHQMGWAKCSVNHYPKNNNMVDVCSVDCCPVLQRIMETNLLQWGQALASVLKNKMMQKHADKIASKLSDSMMSAFDLSGSAYDSVGD